jgi:hypothetical protein
MPAHFMSSSMLECRYKFTSLEFHAQFEQRVGVLGDPVVDFGRDGEALNVLDRPVYGAAGVDDEEREVLGMACFRAACEWVDHERLSWMKRFSCG